MWVCSMIQVDRLRQKLSFPLILYAWGPKDRGQVLHLLHLHCNNVLQIVFKFDMTFWCQLHTEFAPWKLQLHYYYKFLQWMKMLHACISIAGHILEKLLRVKGWGESCMPRCTLRRRPQMRWSIWLTQPVISVGGVGTLLCHISQLSENTNRWSASTCHLCWRC